jgi:hypothetical protein
MSRVLSARLFQATVALLVGWFALSRAGYQTGSEEPAPPPAPTAGGLSDRTAVLELLEQARRACGQVRDYRCVLVTRERLSGTLKPEQVMDMDFRARPFAVHLRFRKPAGQEVWYGVGLHGDKMRVRPSGCLGSLTGVLTLDPHAPTVRENSRHAITDAGFANMLDRFIAALEHCEGAEVRLADSTIDDQACRRVEVLSADPDTEWQRALLHLDRETSLPLRVEYYDREGRLLDEATYQGLQLNVGLDAAVFGR